MVFSSRFSLTYRDILVGVVIMLAAFLLRVIVTFERASSDPTFAPPPSGTDQQVYVVFAEFWEAGKWPTAAFQWQPGLSYFLIAVRPLVGRTVGQMTLAVALMGALSCGWMVAIGWLVTRRRWGGYLAGLLLAIYPVSIFYSTVLLTESLAAVYVTLFLLLALWQREKRALWRSALIGITLGLMTITRTNLGALWLAWALLLWLDRKPFSIRSFGIHAAVSLAFMALMIAPVTLWNRQHTRGQDFALITTTGMDEVYRGNNRDATGLRSTDPAMSAADDGYMTALINDIRLNPLRFIELQLRKSGLYWSAAEPGNNVDYAQSGLALSPLLRAIPLNFAILAFFGWLGVGVLWFADRRAAIFWTAVHLVIFGGVMLIWAEGRLKQPAVPALVVTAAYGLAQLGEVISQKTFWRHITRAGVTRYALLIAALLLLVGGLGWAADNLPEHHPVGALPTDIHRLDVTFGDTLKLVGWRSLSEWPAAQQGWTPVQHSYVIQLYWQVIEATHDDYNMYLAYIQNGERLAGADRAIGTVSFRPKPTSEWQDGAIYSEIIGFRLPKELPLELDGDIRLGVYRTQGAAGDPNRVIEPVRADSLPDQPDSIVLQRFALFNTGRIGSDLPDFSASEAVFGDQIALKGYTLPDKVHPGESIPIGLYWKALTEIDRDYTVFLHIEDQNGEPAGQFDSPPRNNTLVTSTWPPGYPVEDAITLKMPDTPGLYRVYIGLYDTFASDHLRLFASTADGRWLLGTIEVEN